MENKMKIKTATAAGVPELTARNTISTFGYPFEKDGVDFILFNYKGEQIATFSGAEILHLRDLINKLGK